MPASTSPTGRRKVCPRFTVLDELLQAGAALTVSDLLKRLNRRRVFCDPATIYAAIEAIEISFQNIVIERTRVKAGKSRADAFSACFVAREEKTILQE